jgi:hypothetical protein
MQQEPLRLDGCSGSCWYCGGNLESGQKSVMQISVGGQYWVRTSDFYRVKVALSR